MNVHLLMDAVVRQTALRIAQLAASGGARAALLHVVNQVFMDLASELKRQGLSRQVTADVFGISLRSYERKVTACGRLSDDEQDAEWAGGSTYLLDVRPEYLQREEVRATLAEFRTRHGDPARARQLSQRGPQRARRGVRGAIRLPHRPQGIGA